MQLEVKIEIVLINLSINLRHSACMATFLIGLRIMYPSMLLSQLTRPIVPIILN